MAKAYDVDVETLIGANSIEDPARLSVGTRLWIPGAARVQDVPSSSSSARNGKRNKRYAPGRPFKGFLEWPLAGTVTSPFGYRNDKYHDGVDIGAREGTSILAAADGKVMFSGWGPTGYGMIVIVKHANHLTTLYAHNSKNLVKKNARVRQGQKIAEVGQTGRATGPHLHFEVRNDTHPRDPLLYLP
ncbi:MAG: LysM peptidoglycan-binding domain-containing M23 family metallopeptidase [Nitrospinae bacterium]|nr:LysM peptidoglycan-binding domain-containing M23 family metallopeptidase [Nitrospinota bacterium]